MTATTTYTRQLQQYTQDNQQQYTQDNQQQYTQDNYNNTHKTTNNNTHKTTNNNTHKTTTTIHTRQLQQHTQNNYNISHMATTTIHTRELQQYTQNIFLKYCGLCSYLALHSQQIDPSLNFARSTSLQFKNGDKNVEILLP